MAKRKGMEPIPGTEEFHVWCKKHGVFIQSDNKIGVGSHYLAGDVIGPRFGAYNSCIKVMNALAEKDITPTWEVIEDQAKKLAIRRF